MKALLIGTLAVTAALRVGAQTPRAGAPVLQHTLEQEFRELLQERHGRSRADLTEFVARTTGDTLVLVGERGTLRRLSREQVLTNLPAIAVQMPPETEFTQAVEEVAVRSYGDIAIVHYRLESRMVFNGEPVRKQRRCTEVFRRQDGAWQSVALQETVIPGVIVPAAVDPTVYDDYVGQYRVFGDHVYTVTREENRRLFDSPSGGRLELMPETESTFVLRGSLYRVIFMRSAQGAVTHLRLREFPGVEYNALRLR